MDGWSLHSRSAPSSCPSLGMSSLEEHKATASPPPPPSSEEERRVKGDERKEEDLLSLTERKEVDSATARSTGDRPSRRRRREGEEEDGEDGRRQRSRDGSDEREERVDEFGRRRSGKERRGQHSGGESDSDSDDDRRGERSRRHRYPHHRSSHRHHHSSHRRHHRSSSSSHRSSSSYSRSSRSSRSRSRSPSSRSSSSPSRSPPPPSFSSSRSRSSRSVSSSVKFDPSAVAEALKAVKEGKPIPIPSAPLTTTFPVCSSSSGHSPADVLQHVQLTRGARRLFVGNLPAGSGLTDVQMSHFFTLTAQSLGVVTPQPILSSWLSNDGQFGFVEFRAVQDTTRVVSQLEGTGLLMGGRQLRIGRPADYQPPPLALLNFVVGFPLGVVLPDVPATHPALNFNPANPHHQPAPSIIPSALDVTTLAALPSQVTQLLSSLAPPLPPPSAPSRVVVLLNALTEDELTGDDGEYNELVTDIRDEVERYGAVERCIVPRGEKDGTEVKAMGRVLILYDTIEAAEAARQALHGRSFAGRTIQAQFYPEAALNAGQLTQ